MHVDITCWYPYSSKQCGYKHAEIQILSDPYPPHQVDTLSINSAAADRYHYTVCSDQGFLARRDPRVHCPLTSDIHMDESKETVAKRVAINGIIAYGIFGAVQVFYRLWKNWTTSSRMREMLKDMPATTGKSHDAPGGWIKDLQANLHRLQDWRLEICDGRPISKNLGFSWFPGAYTLMANDPAIVRHILKDEFNKYTKSDTSINPLFLEDFLGSGIFVVQHGVGSKDEGREWSHMRKVSAQVFNRKNFNSLMQDIFIEKAEVLRHFLETKFLPKSGNVSDAYVVDIQSCFFNFTFDSIMRIFFGEDSNMSVGEKNRYGQAFDEANVAVRMHGVKSIAPFFIFSTFLPWPFGGRHGGLARATWDFFSPWHRRLKRCTKVLDAEADRLVKKCLEDPKFSERKDLLALFLQAKFSNEFVKHMVLHLIIAGRDTTACLLSWVFYELTKNQEIQKRLHEEIMEKLPPGTPMDWKSLSPNEMPYLHGVIYEALRLWPPVPFDPKMAFEDDVLPGGWKVPKFATVAFIPYNMGRDAQRYPEPLEFRPERWIPFNAPPQHEFPVFQAGPRICLGMDMAIFEAKTATVELLRHCRFEMVPGQEITYGDKITMDIKSNGKDQFLVYVKPW